MIELIEALLVWILGGVTVMLLLTLTLMLPIGIALSIKIFKNEIDLGLFKEKK